MQLRSLRRISMNHVSIEPIYGRSAADIRRAVAWQCSGQAWDGFDGRAVEVVLREEAQMMMRSDLSGLDVPRLLWLNCYGLADVPEGCAVRPGAGQWPDGGLLTPGWLHSPAPPLARRSPYRVYRYRVVVLFVTGSEARRFVREQHFRRLGVGHASAAGDNAVADDAESPIAQSARQYVIHARLIE